MRAEFVYLLTLTERRNHAWQLAGVFLDVAEAKKAKEFLIKNGIDEELIDIDKSPIGVVSLTGVDTPYIEPLLN